MSADVGVCVAVAATAQIKITASRRQRSIDGMGLVRTVLEGNYALKGSRESG